MIIDHGSVHRVAYKHVQYGSTDLRHDKLVVFFDSRKHLRMSDKVYLDLRGKRLAIERDVMLSLPESVLL